MLAFWLCVNSSGPEGLGMRLSELIRGFGGKLNYLDPKSM